LKREREGGGIMRGGGDKKNGPRRGRKNVPRHILCSISFGSKSFHLDKAVVYYKQRKQ